MAMTYGNDSPIALAPENRFSFCVKIFPRFWKQGTGAYPLS